MTGRDAPHTIANELSKSGDTGRFTLSAGGERRGHLLYTLPDSKTLNIDYVEVNTSLRGQGIGKELVDAAVAWADEHGRHVVPFCSYARSVLSRTPKGGRR